MTKTWEEEKIPFEQIYTTMLRIRMFEEKIVELYPEQEIKCPVHLYIGQEAIATGVCLNLRKEDYVFSNHRNHGHYLAKGGDMASLMAELYGKSTGCSKGKGGSMHVIDVELGILGTSAIVGGGIPIGVGTALASKLKDEDRVTVIFFGDGAYDEGVFYESFNFASLYRLPVIFILENNSYATNSHTSKRQDWDIYASYPRKRVWAFDGNDVASVYRTMKEGYEIIKNGAGPYIIEASTYRWKEHVGIDDYIWKGHREEFCPIKKFEAYLLKEDLMNIKQMKNIAELITDQIEKAVLLAKNAPFPAKEDLLKDVYSTSDRNN